MMITVETMELCMIYVCLGVAGIGAIAELLYALTPSGVPAENAKNGYYKLTRYSHCFSIIVLLLIWMVGKKDIIQMVVIGYFCMIFIWLAALLVGVVYLIVQKIRGKGVPAINVAGMGKRCVIRSLIAFLMWWIVI